MTNLYDTLFNNNEQEPINDIALEIINQLHGHVDFNCISEYHDITSYNKLFSEEQRNLSVMHMNARSLPKNFDKITVFLNSLVMSPDIIAITETWLNDTNKYLFQLPGYHPHHLTRQTRTHGGVTLFISNDIHSEPIDTLTIINDDIEILTIKINVNSVSYYICAIYRPHSKHERVKEFSNILNTLLLSDTVNKKKNNNCR